MALARIPSYDELGPHDLTAFAAAIRGTVIRPGDEGYDEARDVHDTTIDRRPICIVRAASAADVARTVVFARVTGLELAVRSGTHGVTGFGTSAGGIVLDLGAMKGLHIDPIRRLAWAQAGVGTDAYTAAAAEHGLAIDALESVEIVTADGRILVASAIEDPDLFRAVRGGGGDVGVVTRFQFRLCPMAIFADRR